MAVYKGRPRRRFIRLQANSAGILVAALIALFLILVSKVVSYTLDDAYISYRYAENFAGGLGLVFNPGERVEGYTNFLWVMLLSGCSYLNLSVPVMGKILGIVFASISIVLTYRIVSRFTSTPWIRLAPCFLLASQPLFVSGAVSGLETAMFTLLICWSAERYLDELKDPSGRPTSSLLFLLIALTRPDGVLNFVVALIHRYTSQRTLPLNRRTEVLRVLWFVVPGVVYFVARWTYYDSFWPNTFLAKGMATSFLWGRGWTDLIEFAKIVAIWPWLLWLVSLRHAPSTPLVFLSLQVLARLIFAVSSGGDWNHSFRFLIPTLPLLYAISTLELDRLASLKQSLKMKEATLGFFLLLLTVGWHGYKARTAVFPSLDIYAAGLQQAHISFASWLKENAPPGSSIALEDAGAIPYFSKLVAIDILGLTDHHIGSLPGNFFHKTDTDYILGRRPTFIVLISRSESQFGSNFLATNKLYKAMLHSKRYKRIGTAVFNPAYYLWIYGRLQNPIKAAVH